MFTHTTSIQCSIGTPRYSNQTRKINKIIQIEREEVKLSLYADHMWKNHRFDYTDLCQQRN